MVIFNNIYQIERGIHITSSYSKDNYFYHNNIISNTPQVSDNGNNIWNNTFQEGNYWSDYLGLDNGATGRIAGDGIGDTNIPHQGLDNYPFIKPFGWLFPGTNKLTGPGDLDIDGNYLGPFFHLSVMALHPVQCIFTLAK